MTAGTDPSRSRSPSPTSGGSIPETGEVRDTEPLEGDVAEPAPASEGDAEAAAEAAAEKPESDEVAERTADLQRVRPSTPTTGVGPMPSATAVVASEAKAAVVGEVARRARRPRPGASAR